MATINEILRYLNDNNVHYGLSVHVPTFSARQTASATHVYESEMAKTLVIQADKQKWMVVLRADHRIDQRLLRRVLETHSVHLVPEEELEQLFPTCEIGTMPPFGNLYGLPVLVDTALSAQEEIAFNACTHTETVRMKFEDFARLAKPMIATFASSAERVGATSEEREVAS